MSLPKNSPTQPRKPIFSAADVLFGGTSGNRRENNKNTVVAGIAITLIKRSEKALEALRAIGHPDGHVPIKRVRKVIKARAPYLRRANPRHPEQIDEAIVELLHKAVFVENCKTLQVRREGIAAWLKVPEHSVSQSLERLNKRGLVGPERNLGPHDSMRDRGWGGTASAWGGSIRDVRMDRLLELFEAETVDGPKHRKSTGPR